MKHIYTTIIVLFTTISAFAGTITASTNSLWENTTTWNLNRIPQNGDSIIIPANITVMVDVNVDLDNVVIIVAGTLELNNGKLKLGTASRVIVQSSGKIKADNSDDQITIGTAFKFKGTQVLQTGSSYADATTGNAPNGFSSLSTLPVIFQSFYVNRDGGNIQLKWVTSQEVNNEYYEIEKSTDARSWMKIVVVLGAGTTNTISQYAYTDKNVKDAVAYYRIKQTDMNGDVHYSAVRSVRNENQQAVTNIYASSKQTITIEFNSDVKDNVNIQVVSMNGQVVARKRFEQAAYRLTINMMNEVHGVYAVQVSDGQGWSEVKKIIL
jgi:hypothetical protein